MGLLQPNKVAAEAAAGRLWKKYGFAAPKDLDLETLAFAQGVAVVVGPLESADARLVRKGHKAVLRVSERIREGGRKRFAIAHELGHFEIHEAVNQLSACTSEDMVADYKGSGPEVEANWFAAELLMPRFLFAKRVVGAFPSFAEVRVLADDFRTSLTATAVRFAELSDEHCAFVVSQGGRVLWWRANDGFRERARIWSGMELPEETATGAIHRGEKLENKPVRVDASAWGGPSDETDWWEDVVVLDNYGQTLSLIRAG